jgi:ribonucleoside-diphosphate reductase alpha chain
MWTEVVVVMRDGNLLPNSVTWDDQLIGDILVTQNQVNTERVIAIARPLREDVERTGLKEIKVSLLEKIIDAKMLEYGVPKARLIHLHRSLFKRENGLNLSPNAFKVLRKSI